MEYEFVNKQDYKLGYLQENIEMVLYTLAAFLIPFTLGHPQLLVGTLVNSALFLAALNLKGFKMLPIIIAPSLGVLTKGLIFGPLTIFLVYMIPFIWIGNALLVYSFKAFNVDKKVNSLVSIGISAAAKTIFLFAVAYVLFKLNLVPQIFLTTMGLFQLYTAVAGGIVALGIHKAKKYVN